MACGWHCPQDPGEAKPALASHSVHVWPDQLASPELALFLLALSGLSENLLWSQTETHGGLNEGISKLMFAFCEKDLAWA